MQKYLVLFFQLILIFFLVIIVLLLFRLKKANSKNKRLERFAIDSLTKKEYSLFEKFEYIINIQILFLNKFFNRSVFLKKYASKYNKYIDKSKNTKEDVMSYISNKFYIACFTSIITIFSDILRFKAISVVQLLVAILFGFFIPDIFWYVRNIERKRALENDILKAVTIMSNAYKSGRSTMQAIEIVSNELTGPISAEFRKMYIDLTYGLELDIVFNRFAKRINTEEVKYMASSIIILNKTGGNILNVFSSIEKGFLERKKLNDELKSVTALSELVFKILVLIPFIIFVVIYVLNPNYFDSLITTAIGKIILIIIVVIYLLYILVSKKIMKKKEW